MMLIILTLIFVILCSYRYTYKTNLQKEASPLVYVYIYIYLWSSSLLLTIKTNFDFFYIHCFFFWFLFLLMLIQLLSFFVNVFILQRNNLYLLDNILLALFKTILIISILEYIQSCDLEDILNYFKVVNTLSLPNVFKLCLFIIDLSAISLNILLFKLYILNNVSNLFIILSQIPIDVMLCFLIYLFFFLGYGVLIFSSFLISAVFLLFMQDWLFISFPNAEILFQERFNSVVTMKELGGNVDRVKKIMQNYIDKISVVNKDINWNLKEQNAMEQKLKNDLKPKEKFTWIKQYNANLKKKLEIKAVKDLTYGDLLNSTDKLNYFSEMSQLYDICISKDNVKKIRLNPSLKMFLFKDYSTNARVLNESLSNTVTFQDNIDLEESAIAIKRNKRQMLHKYATVVNNYPVAYKLWLDTVSTVEFSKLKREPVDYISDEEFQTNLLSWSQRLHFTDIVLSHNLKSKNLMLEESQIILSVSDYLHFKEDGSFISEINPLFSLNLANCRVHNVLPIASSFRLELLKNPLIRDVSYYNMKQVNLSGLPGTRKFWGDLIFSLGYIDGKYEQVTCELKNISKLALLNQISSHGLNLLNFEKMSDVEIQRLENHTFIWYNSQVYNSFVKFNNLTTDVQSELLQKFNVTFCIGFDLSEIEKTSHVVYTIDELTSAYFQGFCKKLNYEITNNIGDIIVKKKLLYYLQHNIIKIKFIKY